MSDNEGKSSKAVVGWTDRERLVYLFALIETSTAGTKLNYNDTPRPNGRSLIACQRIVDRLKGTLKVELEALKAGQAFTAADGEAKPKTPKKATPKRKKDVDANGGADDEKVATPSKKSRGRPAKKQVQAEKKSDDEEMAAKEEVKEEVEDGVDG